MPKFIYSTLANDTTYANYAKGGADLPSTTKKIKIKGGVGVPDKKENTVQGVVTEVSDEEHEHLQKNAVFQRHLKNGFVFVSDKARDPEKVAADMESRDPSAPIVPEDFDKTDTVKPKGGKGK